MRALVGDVEERAFEMRAEHPRVLRGESGDDADAFGELGHRRGHERQDGPRRTVPSVDGERGADRVGPVVEGGAAPAMTVDVDEAGSEPSAVGIRHDALRCAGDGGHPVVTRSHRADPVAVEQHPGVMRDTAIADETGGMDHMHGHPLQPTRR